MWSFDIAASALTRIGAAFEQANPGTKIEVVDVGYDNTYDKISVGLNSGAGLPDVVTIETDRAPGYLSEFPQGFADLSSVSGIVEDDFDPFKWAAQCDADGHLRMAPWDSGTVGLFYRSDILEEAGVDPDSIATWDDLLGAGTTIKNKTGHTTLSVDVSTGVLFQMLLQQQGLGLFDASGAITITSPEAVHTLSFMQELNDAGLIKNVKGWDARVTSAKAGDSAFTVEGVWWMATLMDEAPEHSGKYGVRALPPFVAGGAETTNNGGSALAVTGQAKNPNLAAAFVAHVVSAQTQADTMEEDGMFPSALGAFDSPYFQQPLPYFGDQPVYALFGKLTAEIPPIVLTSDNALASDAVGNAVVASVINGEDPAAALQAAAEQIATATKRKIA